MSELVGTPAAHHGGAKSMALMTEQRRARLKSAYTTAGAVVLGLIILYGVTCGLPYSY